MDLLLLTPEFDGFGGGITTFYRALAPALCEAGIKLRVIEGSAFHAAANRSARVVDGVSVETLEQDRLFRWWDSFPAFASLPNLRRHLAAAWAMWEQVDYGAKADIVEATDWGLLFVPPAVGAVQPLVVQCHGSIGQVADHDPVIGQESDNVLTRLIERDVLSTVAAIQTYSRANADFWRAETGREITAIPPAWSRPPDVEPQQITERGLVIGRLQRWKGPVVLCEALRHLGYGAPCFDWIGRDTVWGSREGSTAEHLAKNYVDLWQSKFVHHPPVPAVEVARRQARAFFNVVPSTWDMFNLTVVEGLASGRPTIVSTGAGASELIEDGVNGYLFANEDAESLAGAIERVLRENPSRLATIGREAQNTVRVRLNPKKIAAQRIAAYRAAIDGFRTRPPAPVGGWVGDVCRPDKATGHEMSFLENFPLRALTKHVAGRLFRRIRSQ